MYDIDTMNRLKRYEIPQNALIGVLNSRFKIKGETLPEDAVISHVHHDFASRSFVVFVWSESFDPVEDGGLVPLASDRLTLEACEHGRLRVP